MASASMPSNSDIKPIFSDVEAKIINDYFKQLYENLKVYLTIQDLEFLINMLNNSIDNKNNNNNNKKTQKNKNKNKNKNNNHTKNKNNNNKIKNKSHIKFFFTFALFAIKVYKNKILNIKTNNNINNKNNKNNNKKELKEETKDTIKTIKKYLIEKIILNPKYFNQSIIQQKEQEFVIKDFIFADEDLIETLENFEPVISNNNNSQPLILPSVPSKPLPKNIKNKNAITPENAVRDIKKFVDNSFTKKDSELRKELNTLKQQYGKVFLGTRKTTRVGESNIDLPYQPYHSLLYSKNDGVKLTNDILTLRNHISSQKAGMRKLTKNKTTKNKTTKHKTTKHKTTKNKKLIVKK